MARVQKQKKQNHNHQKQQHQTKSFKATRVEKEVKPRDRVPSKAEQLLYKYGLIGLVVTIVVVAVVFAINSIGGDDTDSVYDGYTHITLADLTIMTEDDGFGTFGNFEYFLDNDGYEDVADKLYDDEAGQTIYVYLYRSSDVNEEIKTAIEAIPDFESRAFFLIDLDDETADALTEIAAIEHLGLSAERDNQLLVFRPESEDNMFESTTVASWIVQDLGKIE
ncbi:MAG: hypothetical protein K9K93_07130 [Acholeplasmataceae bacterium]|nr:hypothetical protein [Acholeplasmataceae bacterium]